MKTISDITREALSILHGATFVLGDWYERSLFELHLERSIARRDKMVAYSANGRVWPEEKPLTLRVRPPITYKKREEVA